MHYVGYTFFEVPKRARILFMRGERHGSHQKHDRAELFLPQCSFSSRRCTHLVLLLTNCILRNENLFFTAELVHLSFLSDFENLKRGFADFVDLADRLKCFWMWQTKEFLRTYENHIFNDCKDQLAACLRILIFLLKRLTDLKLNTMNIWPVSSQTLIGKKWLKKMTSAP